MSNTKDYAMREMKVAMGYLSYGLKVTKQK